MEYPITDREIYKMEMTQSLPEKLFFLDVVKDINVLVDFGCADGTMLQAVTLKDPTITGIGYDNDAAMIQDARYEDEDNTYTTNFDKVCTIVQEAGGKSALLFSSVLHEVYDSCTNDEIDAIFDKIAQCDFDYLIIRDMLWDATPSGGTEYVEPEHIRTIMDTYPHLHKSFVQHWGPLTERQNFVHFMLKYRYEINWSREVEENYLSIPKQDLMRRIAKLGYTNTIYWNNNSLEFIENKAMEDMGFVFNDRTHLKAVFTR